MNFFCIVNEQIRFHPVLNDIFVLYYVGSPILKEDKMKTWLMVLLAGMAVFISGCDEDVQKEAPPTAGESQEQAGHDEWYTDFEKAKATAKAENKHILIDFSGSDWCGWCVKLDKEVFSQEAFKEYAKDNLILVMADFPRNKSNQSAALQKQNEKLMQEFGVRGFPTVFILGPDGEAIEKTGYQDGGPEAYVEYIKKVVADAK